MKCCADHSDDVGPYGVPSGIETKLAELALVRQQDKKNIIGVSADVEQHIIGTARYAFEKENRGLWL